MTTKNKDVSMFDEPQVADTPEEVKENIVDVIEEETEKTESVSQVPVKEEETVKKSNTVVWQFRYKNYTHIFSKLFGPDKKQLKVLARNWRYPLDLDDPEDKAVHEELLKSQQKDSDFWMIRKVNRGKDKIKDRSQTLKKLLDMSHDQLMTFFTSDELVEMGLFPPVPSKEELIMAIVDSKKLTAKED